MKELPDLFPDLATWKVCGFKTFPPTPSSFKLTSPILNVLKRQQKEVERALKEWRKELDSGSDPEKSWQELQKRANPTRRGRKTFDWIEIGILKWYYVNFQACIKHVWQQAGIRPSEYEDWGEDESAYLEEEVPGITKIFTKEELLFLTAEASCASIACNIIINRLSKTRKPPYRITSKAFRNKLAKLRDS